MQNMTDLVRYIYYILSCTLDYCNEHDFYTGTLSKESGLIGEWGLNRGDLKDFELRMWWRIRGGGLIEDGG